MGRFALLMGLAVFFAFAAASQEPVPPPGASAAAPGPPPAVLPPLPPIDPAQFAFELGMVVPGDDATIGVEVQLESIPVPQIRFLCEVRSKAYMRDAWVRMVVDDSRGLTVHESRLDLPVAPGANKCQFLWDADRVAWGVYTARIMLMQSGTFEECRCEMTVSKLAQPFLEQRVAEAVRETGETNRHLESMASNGVNAPYVFVRAAIAADFAARAQECLADHSGRRALYYAEYATDTAKSLRAMLTLAGELAEVTGPVPSPRLANIELRDGAFVAQGRPVFLAGGRGGDTLVRDMPKLHDYGLNLVALDVSSGAPGPEVSTDALGAVRTALELADKLNISVTVLTSPLTPSGPANVRLAAELGAEPVEARDAVGRSLQATASALRGEPMLNSLCIAQQPAFSFGGPSVREGFIARLHELYPDVDVLNRLWKTRFTGVDEITVVWDPGKKDYHVRPSFQYDWQTYHQWLGTEFFRWMVGAVDQVDPRIPLYVELSEDALAAGESKLGIDREGIAALVDLSGVSVSNSPTDGVYAMQYPHSSVIYTLLRSLAPEKPILNSRHLILTPADPSGPRTRAYVHSVMWESAMAGLNGSALWEWARTPVGQGGILDRPEALDAYVTAAMDLNRLSDIVHAFQQAPAPVAILWSMPAKIYGDGAEYLGSVQLAYEGLSFGGQQIRFITEDQIARFGLDGVQVLVVPNMLAIGDEMTEDLAFKAIVAYMERGGAVIKTGNPIPFDARGRSRKDVLIPSIETILVRGKETSTSYLGAIDSAYGEGGLDPIPRAVDEYGYPLEGVRTRYLEINGRAYLYVLNLRKEPVECHLYGQYSVGRDLIRGRNVEFPARLESLDPMLLQLMPVNPAEYMPTAKVGEPPVVYERKARTSRVQGGAPRQR